MPVCRKAWPHLKPLVMCRLYIITMNFRTNISSQLLTQGEGKEVGIILNSHLCELVQSIETCIHILCTNSRSCLRKYPLSCLLTGGYCSCNRAGRKEHVCLSISHSQTYIFMQDHFYYWHWLRCWTWCSHHGDVGTNWIILILSRGGRKKW